MHAARRPLQTFLATMLTVMAMVSVRAGAGDSTLGEKFAFLVGVQNYEGDLNKLNYAEADVDGLAEVLKKNVKLPPDHIVLMTQPQSIVKSPRRYPTKALILEQLDLLLAGLREQDLLIVALAGHGVQFKDDDEERYFCPIDAKLSDRSTLIALGEVRRRMERARAGWKLLFIDASRVDPLNPQSRSALPNVRVEERGGARPPYAGEVITFYGCSKGERAFEDPKSGHGVFFRCLIDGIGGEADLDGDGLGTLGEIRTYVSRNVRNFVRDQHSASQQPELVGNVDPKRVLVAFKPASLLLRQGKELFEKGHSTRSSPSAPACSKTTRAGPRLITSEAGPGSWKTTTQPPPPSGISWPRSGTRNRSPKHIMTGASSTCGPASGTRRSGTSARPSSSTSRAPTCGSTAAWPISAGTSPTRPSPISPRRSKSTPVSPPHSSTEDSPEPAKKNSEGLWPTTTRPSRSTPRWAGLSSTAG